MFRAGIKTPAVLDELEAHLSEDVAQQMRHGLSAEHAFEAALLRIGHASALKQEFAKNGGNLHARLRSNLRGLLIVLGFRAPDPFPALTDFTPGTREILENARTEALQFHHDYIGTEHMLLGLFHAENGIVPAILKRMGVEHEKLRIEVERFVGFSPAREPAAVIPYTPRARRALALAAEEAKSLNRANVGPEHILLGLMLEGGGVAAQVLRSLGADPKKARAEILKQLE
jgi:hypothetical protein